MNITNEQLESFNNNLKQVLVLRKDLNMRKGKCVSQGAHASMKAILNQGYMDEEQNNFIIPLKDNGEITPLGFWLCSNFKKICVYVNSENELLEIYNKAVAMNLPCSLIQDSGLTEFNGIPTYTALSIGPEFEEILDPYTKHLPLL